MSLLPLFWQLLVDLMTNLTSVLNDTIALWRIWYVLSKFQKKASRRSCKTPHNHHHFHCHHHRFCPPCRRQKKLTFIAPLNNMNAQENDFFLSALPLTNTMRGRGTGIPSGPGPILEISTGPQYSLLGAELCCMSPQSGRWGTPRHSCQGSACPSYPSILRVIPVPPIGSIS